jgi:hypothetical protein
MGWGLITAAFNMVGLLDVSRCEVGGISAAGDRRSAPAAGGP